MKRTVTLLTGVLVVVLVLFVNATESEGPDGLQVGDLAGDFELKNTDGSIVSFSSYGDVSGFIVIFTCNTCPYAKMYEQRIIELHNKFKSKGFPVLAINPNDVNKQPGDSFEEMVKRSDEKEYPFDYLYDETQEVALAYGATKTPHVYVLNKESNEDFRVEYIGAIDDSPREASDAKEKYVEAAVDALLSGSKPQVTNKRAIGCTIKWKES